MHGPFDLFALALWQQALLGGVLIGVAVSLTALGLGRIAGISGIVALSLRGVASETGWRRAFIIGLLSAPSLWQWFWPLTAVSIEAGNLRLVLAGLLVGFGTRLGSGCTSGHGVCGIARASVRSLVATVLFMGVAIVTVWLFPVSRGV